MALLNKTQIKSMMTNGGSSQSEAMGQLASILFHSVTQAHILHLEAVNQSYPLHMALSDYYDGLPDLIDSTVEKWQGKYGIIKNYTHKPVSCCLDAVAHMSSVASEVEMLRSKFTDGYIQQEVDNILAHIYQTLYRIKNLTT